MKYILLIVFIVCVTSIILGYNLDVSYGEKLIGGGVLGLFFVFIPLFSYHRWKGRDIKEYMITKENLDKMRDKERRK
ncbi:hypothetical protein ES677_09935 [Bizionia gelidisalsuginis]|uniref:Uncharacterized protein n=2 Tax=Bizionia TaxID=283785 RepID=A0A8H2QFL2_9FLAO|nr:MULTISPECIES: hypothetical protein [Bizionia]TYB76091.1 hypothetical protein ES676_06460 [Bizionia saleffrena]TYC11383.1 hypothetical protein ES677_09935 [Bizionia gelidisalsuginis]